MKRFAIAAVVSVVASSSFGQTIFNDFEAATVGNADMFRAPNFSGSTSGQLDTGGPNIAQVAAGFGTNSTNVLQVSWQFTSAGNWLRLTTFGGARVPNPLVDLNQHLKFDIYTDSPLHIALGIRETGGTGPVGGNGGTTGNIEWVGTSTTMNSATPAGMGVTTGSWNTVSVNLKGAPALGFAGGTVNGVLDGDWGVLEHIAFQKAGADVGPHTVYLDNFRVDTVPEPGTMIALGAGLAALAARRRRKAA